MNKISQITRQAKACSHRAVVVLSGTESWCRQQAQWMLDTAKLKDPLWLSDHAPETAQKCPTRRARSLLGRDLDAVVFDTSGGFDADALGVVSGTVKAGGLFLILVPVLSDWAALMDKTQDRYAVALYPPEASGSRFVQRLIGVIASDRGISVIEQKGRIRWAISTAEKISKSDSFDYGCVTQDQQTAVENLLKVVRGQRRRPAVLSADRGRGKSAALGLAVAELFVNGVKHIVVTAPLLSSLDSVFAQALAMLPEATHKGARLQWRDALLEFIAPDQLASMAKPVELVLVDEAAAIATPILDALLAQYPRIAFATTVHGYEGTGRGFALRFHKTLDTKSRGWRNCHLTMPIRWAADDPLEAFVFRALLLNARAVDAEHLIGFEKAECVIERCDRAQLSGDENSLTALFGLLVNAHYRTRPQDLRHLLDAPNLQVYVQTWKGLIVGTALVSMEGGFDEATAKLIREGKTRPHGHLVPETLAAHLGLHEAAELSCARVMRIAIHPHVQNLGLGRSLLQHLRNEFHLKKVDFMATSFGATPPLLRFWQGCGYHAARLGLKRGAASGAHSALMLSPLSEHGEHLAEQASAHFQSVFVHQLGDGLADLEPEVALTLLARNKVAKLNQLDQRDLNDFAHGKRNYEDCLGALWRWFLSDKSRLLSSENALLFLTKIVQRKSWPNVAENRGMSGRKHVMEQMREALLLIQDKSRR